MPSSNVPAPIDPFSEAQPPTSWDFSSQRNIAGDRYLLTLNPDRGRLPGHHQSRHVFSREGEEFPRSANSNSTPRTKPTPTSDGRGRRDTKITRSGETIRQADGSQLRVHRVGEDRGKSASQMRRLVDRNRLDAQKTCGSWWRSCSCVPVRDAGRSHLCVRWLVSRHIRGEPSMSNASRLVKKVSTRRRWAERNNFHHQGWSPGRVVPLRQRRARAWQVRRKTHCSDPHHHAVSAVGGVARERIPKTRPECTAGFQAEGCELH